MNEGVLVTGAAGFIGSHLCEKLLKLGERVIGVDAITPFYSPSNKRRNIQGLLKHRAFEFIEGDVRDVILKPLLQRCRIVYHLAAQPGVRASWGAQFEEYVEHNIRGTQSLLEQIRDTRVEKLVYASSSSVYGNSGKEILSEDDRPMPFSPYGVTKLAAEQLCLAYHANHGVPALSLRFFTVFGPRQRPDMAFQRVIAAHLDDAVFEVYGDGNQVRDFTYIDDTIEGCVRAASHGRAGTVYNLGGTNHSSLNDVLVLIEGIAGKPLKVVRNDRQPGDVLMTRADILRAQSDFAYAPSVTLSDGLRAQFEFEKLMRAKI